LNSYFYFSGCGKGVLLCHAERNEESLPGCDAKKKKERFLVSLGMTKGWGILPQRCSVNKIAQIFSGQMA
jgi:hypothetical protein